MVKKMIVVGGAAALLSSVVLGVPLYSYARCGMSWLRESAEEAMPLEWELKRARQMMVDLKPEIQGNAKRIAREKIEVSRLQAQLEQNEGKLAKTQSDIERLSEDLRAESSYYTYGERTYTSAQVKNELRNRFERFKTRKATAEKLRQMLSAREASLKSAHEQMDASLAMKSQLEVEIENLQARLSALRVAQTNSQLNLDDSQLARTRELLDSIATRIDVEEETVAIDVEYFGEIDLDAPSDEDLLDEITLYFNGEEPSSEAIALSVQLD